MKPTAFSIADQLDEAGHMVVARRAKERQGERVIHYIGADMIRSLAIKLHRERRTSTICFWFAATGWLAVGLLIL